MATLAMLHLIHACRCRLEGHPLRVRHKQDWGRGFIQAAVPSESDAGIDGVEPASSFVIKTVRPRAPYGALLRCGLWLVQWRRTRNSMKKRDLICTWSNEITQHQSADN